jgi:hypothetical protein
VSYEAFVAIVQYMRTNVEWKHKRGYVVDCKSRLVSVFAADS